MSENQKITIARECVDQQITTMRNGGMLSDDISEEEYRGLVEEITEAIDLK